jgi:hypothetical protein
MDATQVGRILSWSFHEGGMDELAAIPEPGQLPVP